VHTHTDKFAGASQSRTGIASDTGSPKKIIIITISYLLEEHDLVELAEDGGGRLVDGEDDGAALPRKPLEDVDDVQRRVRVETRGRLVQEQDACGTPSQPSPAITTRRLEQKAKKKKVEMRGISLLFVEILSE
jgi:hypothetical protein